MMIDTRVQAKSSGLSAIAGIDLYQPIIRRLLAGYLIFACMSCQTKEEAYKSFNDYPEYRGNDLGLTYSPERPAFKLWSPAAEAVRVQIYSQGMGGTPEETFDLDKGEQGVWSLSLKGDYTGKFYTFQVKAGEQWLDETPGPYAKAVGVNGVRACILDLEATNPEGWEEDERPPLNSYNDIVIYEIHLRDISTHESSGIKLKGKFLGLTETGTVSPYGEKTGLDHLKELGVTHVHILPMFDFRSIDETHLDENKFNWGYEPQNYNVPEGSYATDPYDPAVRIGELKKMIKTLHDNGIRVIMDVVYNHTGYGNPAAFNLSLTAPGYYYRTNKDGQPSNASACGNETASERPMMRKFIIESVKYWVSEYHIDGFRFDLMGIHDIETMNEVSRQLREIDPTLFIYGEGWKAGRSPLPDHELALKKNIPKIQHVAAFSDEIRDGIKGSWNKWEEPGFVSGNLKSREGVKFGIVGGTWHPQIIYERIMESKAPWAPQPSQCIVYVSCHDNHTLYDKLKIVNPESPEEDILKMHVLSNTIILTSQGIPFLHAGVDFVRTKKGVENSYDSPDSINQIDWTRKTTYKHIFSFYRELIQLRKDHPAFRMHTREMITSNLKFMDFKSGMNLIGYTLNGKAAGDSWNSIVVLFNGSAQDYPVAPPRGTWNVVVQGTRVDPEGIRKVSGKIMVPAYSAVILAQF